MTITITGFARSPDRGRGLARDMRVRWALEEVEQPYAVALLEFAELKQPDHLARNPFGQIPTFACDADEGGDGGLVLFESGAIVLHLAERFGGLLPDDPAGRARAIMWMFAAVNTVEPPILERQNAVLLERDRPWHAERLPVLEARIDDRLAQLAAHLGGADWLDGAFSAGDLMMASVLLRLQGSGLLDAHPLLVAYLERAKARPAYGRAFAAQLAVFEASLSG